MRASTNARSRRPTGRTAARPAAPVLRPQPHDADVQSLIDLVQFSAGPDRRTLRGWNARQLLTTGAEFMALYAQVAVLDHRLLGEGFEAGLALMFVLGIYVFVTSRNRIHVLTARCLARRGAALGRDLMHRFRRMPLVHLHGMRSSATIDHIVDDLSQLMNAAPALVDAPRALLRMALGAMLMMVLSPTVALAAVLSLVGLVVLLVGQQALLADGHRRIDDARTGTTRLLRGHLDGAAAIKQHSGRASAVARAFEAVSDALRAGRTRMYSLFYGRGHLATAGLYLLLGVNVFALPGLLGIEMSAMLAVNLIVLWLVFSVTTLSSTLPELADAATALGRLRALQAAMPDALLEPDAGDGVADLGGFEQLSVQGAAFVYPSSGGREAFALEPVDVCFRRGEIVFITGHNGSGKSTFLKLLTGLYAPTAGAVRVDGRSVEAVGLATYRRLFTTIFTDHHLFERAYGLDPARIAAGAPALLDAMELSDKTGFDGQRITRTGLSTGQRKRLAMVLARLSDRPVLVFDEWAADQDPEFRAAFYREHLPALRRAGKLVIAVTHDEQYFDLCDRRLDFVDGRLVEAQR